MTGPQRNLADYCEWFLEDIRRPCYAPASFVLVRPAGETLRFTCAEHAPAWAGQIQGRYLGSNGRSGRRGAVAIVA